MSPDGKAHAFGADDEEVRLTLPSFVSPYLVLEQLLAIILALRE